MPKYIIDDKEISSDSDEENSDEENSSEENSNKENSGKKKFETYKKTDKIFLINFLSIYKKWQLL